MGHVVLEHQAINERGADFWEDTLFGIVLNGTAGNHP